MMSNKIEGWKATITGSSQAAELRILGPGELHIVIPDFSLEKLIYESVAILEDSSVVGTIDFTYTLPQGEGALKLSFNYINEPPDAYLSMGCAFWKLPMDFAQQLIHIFLLGVSNPIKPTHYKCA